MIAKKSFKIILTICTNQISEDYRRIAAEAKIAEFFHVNKLLAWLHLILKSNALPFTWSGVPSNFSTYTKVVLSKQKETDSPYFVRPVNVDQRVNLARSSSVGVPKDTSSAFVQHKATLIFVHSSFFVHLTMLIFVK